MSRVPQAAPVYCSKPRGTDRWITASCASHGSDALIAALSTAASTTSNPRVMLVQNAAAEDRSSVSSIVVSYLAARRAASAASVIDPTAAKQNSCTRDVLMTTWVPPSTIPTP